MNADGHGCSARGEGLVRLGRLVKKRESHMPYSVQVPPEKVVEGCAVFIADEHRCVENFDAAVRDFAGVVEFPSWATAQDVNGQTEQYPEKPGVAAMFCLGGLGLGLCLLRAVLRHGARIADWCVGGEGFCGGAA